MNYFQFVFLYVRQKALEKTIGLPYKDTIAHHSFFVRIKRAIGTILFHKFKKRKAVTTLPIKLQNKVLFFANTINQFYALEAVQEEMKGKSGYLLLSSNVKLRELTEAAERVIINESEIRKYWYRLPLYLVRSFLYSPFFTFRYLDALVTNFGYLELYQRYLRKYRPQLVIVSHDHLPLYRTLFWAAQKLNIRTAYIQHAAVSDLFPPLCFDLAILDGNYSLEKYRIDPRFCTLVKVIGSGKYDSHYKYRKKNKELNVIGISYGIMDEVEAVSGFIRHMSDAYREKSIIVRPHPADKRPVTIQSFPNVVISDSRQENAISFLKKIDVLISGNSTMLLEATAMNILAVYFIPFCSNNMLDDYYGFARNGVVEKAADYNEAVNKIENNFAKEVYMKAKFYVNNIGEEYEGKTAKKIADFISQYLEKERN